jgi:hypothetical protein
VEKRQQEQEQKKAQQIVVVVEVAERVKIVAVAAVVVVVAAGAHTPLDNAQWKKFVMGLVAKKKTGLDQTWIGSWCTREMPWMQAWHTLPSFFQAWVPSEPSQVCFHLVAAAAAAVRQKRL